MRDIIPDKLIIAGDLVDFYSLSKFDKNPSRAEDLQYEIDTAYGVMSKLRRSVPCAEVVLVDGNHEARLRKFLNSNSKALRNLRFFKIENLLSLDDLKIKYHKGNYQLSSNFIIRHGVKYGKYPARGELDTTGDVNGISGHAHKTDYACKASYNNTYQWFSIGHLADKTKIDAACEYSQFLQWSCSFALIMTHKEFFNVEIIQCDDNKFFCKYNQRAYE